MQDSRKINQMYHQFICDIYYAKKTIGASEMEYAQAYASSDYKVT